MNENGFSLRPMNSGVTAIIAIVVFALPTGIDDATAQESGLIPRFDMPASGLVLARETQKGAFVGVTGRKSAMFGYEDDVFEAWVYPLKILRDFELSFQIEDYPLEIAGADVMRRIEVRPEATMLTYAHAAFTVTQIVYAPVGEPGIVILLDVDSVRPLQITCSFRPDLNLMWPAGLMTGNLGWDGPNQRYFIVEETDRFAGIVGAPGASDISVMPYQEEPRDAPTRFVLSTRPDISREYVYPIVISGSITGRTDAEHAYDEILANASELYRQTTSHYADLLSRTVTIRTPDNRLNAALDWARVGMDKGFVDNPSLGTGLVAGYRTSGASERPGFAWFFGRDALWTVFALTATGNYSDARAAVNFLASVQREDGKVPHEISQSAAFLPWFQEYSYPWNSADATPMYVIAHADLWRASGDNEYLRSKWPSIKDAYRFSAGTDTDGNGLIENEGVGHGWVEGGALYPAHEEIYMQGLWIQASNDLAELADVMNEPDLAAQARRAAERTRAATERAYWQENDGYYAFATRSGREHDLYVEDTVLPAVPLWWETLDEERSQREIDHLGSGALATDWGTRILSEHSPLYDPLSYHNGSVWPLFTGWSSMAAYRHDRPHVGYQALMANALLTFQDAFGYVTELLSGRFNTAFGRSSHHQVWSEAMVTTPAVKGLLGLFVADDGRRLVFEPQLPANWPFVEVDNVSGGETPVSLRLERSRDQTRVVVVSGDGSVLPALSIGPALPLDATIDSVVVDGTAFQFTVAKRGDAKRVHVELNPELPETEIVIAHSTGTDVYVYQEESAPGSTNGGLRILRSRADGESLRLIVEGLAGRQYDLIVRSDRTVAESLDSTLQLGRLSEIDTVLRVSFEGEGGYVRRDITLRLE